MRTAVITMVRADALNRASLLLRSLENQLSDRRRHFVLLNDRTDPHVVTSLRGRPHTSVFTPGRNLGVAHGRQRLVDAALDDDRDLIVSLDDDLVIPADFLDALENEVQHLIVRSADQKVGLVAPVLLAGEEMSRLGVGAGDLIHLPADGWSDLVAGRPLPGKAIYHAGIADWKQHYFRPQGALASRIRDDLGISNEVLPELRRRPSIRALVGHGHPISVDTLPGGAVAMTAAAIRQLEGVDLRFAPFGYEDAALAISARREGFANYVLPGLVVAHDMEGRGSARSADHRLSTAGRGRGLLLGANIDAADALDVLSVLMAVPLMQAADREKAEKGSGGRALALSSAGLFEGLARTLAHGTTRTLPTFHDEADGQRVEVSGILDATEFPPFVASGDVVVTRPSRWWRRSRRTHSTLEWSVRLDRQDDRIVANWAVDGAGLGADISVEGDPSVGQGPTVSAHAEWIGEVMGRMASGGAGTDWAVTCQGLGSAFSQLARSAGP